MKKQFVFTCALILISLLIHSTSFAQQKLWGINENQIFNVNEDGSGYSEIPISDSPNLWGYGLRKGADNAFYLAGWGKIYKYVPESHSIIEIAIEDYVEDFFVEPDGTIYGIGGSGLFKIQNGHYFVLYDFEGQWLFNYPTLTDGKDGKVYIASGLTGIISINKDGSNYTTIAANLHSEPNRLLIVNDYLYGIEGDGGQASGFFKIKKDGTDFYKFTDLDSDNWGYARGNLLLGSNGYVYGINYGDKIFRLNPVTDEFSVLFQEPTSESCLRTCMENLIETPDGMLSGIQNSSSRLNKISLDGSEYHSYNFFEFSGESRIVGSLVLDSNGKIHAQSRSYYDEGLGVNGIVSFTPMEGYAEIESVYSFDLGADASLLMKGDNDEIYARMQDGGGTQNGTLLRIASSGVTKVADMPIGFLEENIVDGGDGFIYGIAFAYPEELGSKIIKIDKSSGDFQYFPFVSNYIAKTKLLRHTTGGIYGVSEGGGSPRKGFVFKVNPDLSGVVNIHNGSDAIGKVPLGKLVEGSDGFLYSTFRTGGPTLYGTIFKVNKDGTGYTNLHEFDSKNGRFPSGGLVRDVDGTLFGVTPFGGSLKNGVLYKINEDGSGYAVLHHFSSDMPNASGELILSSDGYLYGRVGFDPNFKIFRIKKDGTDLSTFLEGNIRLFFGAESTVQSYVVSPSDGAAEIPFDITEIQVAEIPGANSYTLELSQFSDFNSIIQQIINNETSFNISSLAPATTYYARVKTNLSSSYGATISFTTQSAPVTYPPKLWGIQDNAVVYMNLDGSQYEKSFQEDINNQVPFPIGGFPNSITLIKDEIFGINKLSNQAQEGITLYKMNGEGVQGIIVEDSQFNTVNITDGRSGFIYGVNICSPSCSLPYIFKFDYNGGSYMQQNINIYGFTPTGGLITITGNKMIGLSGGGGANNRGFMYSIRPDLSGIDILYSFSGLDGKAAATTLLEGHDGRLYGITTTGGLYNFGAVFSIQSNGQNYTKLYDFTSNRKDGTNPVGNLVQDSNHVLYGIGQLSGLHKKGMVFKINPDGSGYSVIYSFDGVLAEQPSGNLLIESDYLYGSASGKFFRVKTNGTDFTILHEGVNAVNMVSFITTKPIEQDTHIIDSPEVGSPGYSFFSVPITKKPFSVQYTLEVSKYADFHELAFTGSGEQPFYSVPYVEIPATNLEYSTAYYARTRSSQLPYFGPVHRFTTLPQTKRLFGLARSGGPTSCDVTLAGGAVFSIELDGSNFIKHRDFPCLGGLLSGSLVKGNDQALYGLNTGITNPSAELFRIDASGNYSIVSNSSDSGWNQRQFMSASNNSFYALGGFESFILQKITPNPPMIVEPQTIASFDNSQLNNISVPTESEDGYLYGLTSRGGTFQEGTMYKVNRDGEDFQVAFNFNQSTGARPSGRMVKDSDGHLYGYTTLGGETGNGNIFRFDPDGTNYTVIHNFDDLESSPMNSLLISGDTLYGMGFDFININHNIFKLHISGEGYSVIYEFNSDDDQNGSVSQLVTDGLSFYGILPGDGYFDLGKIFRIKNDGSEYSVIHEFTNYTGGWIFDELLLVDPDDVLQNEKAQQAARKPSVELSFTENEKLVNISPNPFKSTFNVEVLNKATPAIATIVDVSGRVLYQRELTTGKINELGEDLSAGFYVVRVTQGANESVHRIIKK